MKQVRKAKTRPYRSAVRDAAALRTRSQILDAAREVFAKSGYGAKMAEIAEHAGVALDTVYATVGKKPALFRLLVEAALSGEDREVPALERDYVRRVRAAKTAREKLAIYSSATGVIHQRLAPVLRVLREAAPAHPELAALWREIAERRARNMRMFAGELLATGEMRGGLDVDEIADVIWLLQSAEVFGMMVHERGWTPERFSTWVASACERLLAQRA